MKTQKFCFAILVTLGIFSNVQATTLISQGEKSLISFKKAPVVESSFEFPEFEKNAYKDAVHNLVQGIKIVEFDVVANEYQALDEATILTRMTLDNSIIEETIPNAIPLKISEIIPATNLPEKARL